MRIVRKLFVVLLANNEHGKTTMLNALLPQALGTASPARKGPRDLTSPFGRKIDAYVFVRSYQEAEKVSDKNMIGVLDSNDRDWRTRELVIFPSHLDRSDVEEMINAAHGAGFDAICAAVILRDRDQIRCAEIWQLNWDERWTIPNDSKEEFDWRPQCEALGRDLWTWICLALSP
jgi:hypothetical protein